MKIAVIGGGIVGLATARAVLQAGGGHQVTVLEKEPGVGRHQSTHNSGVLHAGLYYRPGSLKARLAVEGIRKMTSFCREKGIPHEICGKVVVAVDDEEVPRLRALHTRGTENGLAGLRWLDGNGIREIEPHAAGIAGLHVPEEGIVDYRAVCDALEEDVKAAGGEVRTGAGVAGLRQDGASWQVETGVGGFGFDYLINCAGLFCDRLAKLAGVDAGARIVPFRGEYFTLTKDGAGLVNNLIYPVPDPSFPFLGVHFTRMVRGGVEAGPNAVLALAREGYHRLKIRVDDVIDTLGFPGFWQFLRRHLRMCWEEVLRSCSRTLFLRSLQRLVPDLRDEHLAPGGAGVRAQALLRDGTLVQDFLLVEKANALHVLNAPSPAATASLAIAGEIATRLPFLKNP